MAKPGDQKRKSSMRTIGEGIPPKDASAPRVGNEVDNRNPTNRDKQTGHSQKKDHERDPQVND